jgi:type III secretion protein U
MSEKTEQPTARKLREARDKGQVPKSRLFTAGIGTAVAVAVITARAEMMGLSLRGFFEYVVLQAPPPASALSLAGTLFIQLVTLPLLAALAASMATSTVLAGIHFGTEALAPKLERISPFKGTKRLVSLDNLGQLARAAAALVLVLTVFFSELRNTIGPALSAVAHEGAPALSAVLRMLGAALGHAAIALGVAGLFDCGLARWLHGRSLLMSREDVKQEHKSSDGDPRQKAERKALQRKLVLGGPARGVPKATAVVVNPTHVAVALRYAPDECEAPYVVARGCEDEALRIRSGARALGIPLVKNIPLARTLVHLDVGEAVPEELYQAVAGILNAALEHAQTPPQETR